MTHLKRVSVLSLVLASFFVFVMAQSAMAVGTRSGTTISNFATIDYKVGGVDQDDINSSPTGNSDPNDLLAVVPTTFIVDNKVDLTVTAGADVSVIPGTSNIALSFSVTNTGNTTQGYSLSHTTASTSIPMSFVGIYIDNGANVGQFDPAGSGQDTLYTLGDNVKDLNPNGTPGVDDVVNIIIVANAPAGSITNGNRDTYTLVATTLDAGPGSTLADNKTVASAGADNASGTNIPDVVFADAGNDGYESASADYYITTAALKVTKTAVVIDDGLGLVTSRNNPKAIPGAIVEYTITVSNSASDGALAKATGINVSDNLTNEITTEKRLVFDTVTSATDYAGGVTILVTAPNYGNTITSSFVSDIVSVTNIELEVNDTATVKFRVKIQ